MALKRFVILFFVFAFAIANGKNFAGSFDRQNYYDILKSGKMKEVNDEFDLLASSTVSEKEAYEGALLMKKAGLMKIPVEKLKNFKKGRIKLETALANDDGNGEYHFLRLVIQENAPKVAKYSVNLETDKEAVKKSFKSLSPTIREVILDYCKSSKILHTTDL